MVIKWITSKCQWDLWNGANLESFSNFKVVNNYHGIFKCTWSWPNSALNSSILLFCKAVPCHSAVVAEPALQQYRALLKNRTPKRVVPPKGRDCPRQNPAPSFQRHHSRFTYVQTNAVWLQGWYLIHTCPVYMELAGMERKIKTELTTSTGKLRYWNVF